LKWPEPKKKRRKKQSGNNSLASFYFFNWPIVLGPQEEEDVVVRRVGLVSNSRGGLEMFRGHRLNSSSTDQRRPGRTKRT
jgi:hypothetical protein